MASTSQLFFRPTVDLTPPRRRPSARLSPELREPWGYIAPRKPKGSGKAKEKAKGKDRGEGGAKVTVRAASSTSLSHDSSGDSTPTHSPPSSLYGQDEAPLSTSALEDEGCCCCTAGGSGLGTPVLLSPPPGLFEGADDDARGGSYDSAYSPDSAPSTLPSLSPSRTRLFDDDSGTEDDEDLAATPDTPQSVSPISLRKSFVPVATSSDPLLSPPLGEDLYPPLDFGSRHRLGEVRRVRSAPTSQGDGGESIDVFGRTDSPTRSSSPTSLLTKSLRSLALLPNLALPTLPTLPPLRSLSLPPLLLPSIRLQAPEYDIEDLGTIEEVPWEWRGARPDLSVAPQASSSERRTVPRRRPSTENAGDFVGGSLFSGGGDGERFGVVRALAFDDYEASHTAVQLQTFSPPPPPSRKRVTVVPPPPLPRAVVPTLPPIPVYRVISNHRHLLMLSLELSMIHSGKINCPLRQRGVIVRKGSPVGGGASSLRYEVRKVARERARPAAGGS